MIIFINVFTREALKGNMYKPSRIIVAYYRAPYFRSCEIIQREANESTIMRRARFSKTKKRNLWIACKPHYAFFPLRPRWWIVLAFSSRSRFTHVFLNTDFTRRLEVRSADIYYVTSRTNQRGALFLHFPSPSRTSSPSSPSWFVPWATLTYVTLAKSARRAQTLEELSQPLVTFLSNTVFVEKKALKVDYFTLDWKRNEFLFEKWVKFANSQRNRKRQPLRLVLQSRQINTPNDKHSYI